jgi:hypothetical protein
LALVTLAIVASGVPEIEIIVLAIPFAFLSWLVFLASTKPLTQGVVTYLHAWQAPQGSTRPINPQKRPNWTFNFQQTDRHWQPLKDREGLLLPVTEVEFRVEEVHGSPLEEGSQIILEGLRPRRKSRAVQIWNLSPARIPLISLHQEILKGEVTNWEGPRSIPDMRYPGSGRGVEVWNFRLRRVDTQGNLLPSMPIEIRAESIEGTLRMRLRYMGSW